MSDNAKGVIPSNPKDASGAARKTKRDGSGWGGGERGEVEKSRDFWDRPGDKVASQSDDEAVSHPTSR